MASLLDADLGYVEIIKSLGRDFAKDLHGADPISLDQDLYTYAILRRLSAYMSAQTSIKDYFNGGTKKGTSASASHFFAEAVALFLKHFLQTIRPDVIVRYEFPITLQKPDGQKRSSHIKPDISVYLGDTCVAVVECKTNLGRIRTTWKSQHANRIKDVISVFPSAKSYLLVLTERNGSDNLPSKDSEFGKTYFSILNRDTWPTDKKIDDNQLGDCILCRVEKLFAKIGEQLSKMP
jgi:hypothetical protein